MEKRRKQMRNTTNACAILILLVAVLALAAGQAFAQQKPNIVVIMGDDIGIWNIGAYHRGMMAGTHAESRQARQRGHADSPTITRRRAVRQVAPHSSPASCRSAPA